MKKAKIIGLVLFLLVVPFFSVSGNIPDVGPEEAIERITRVAFTILISLSVLFIIIAAFYFVTASGNDDTLGKARKMLLYAVLGIILAILAQGLVGFIDSSLRNN